MKAAKGHPKPPTINQFIESVDDLCDKRKVDKIFLCTDETMILEKMRARYGEKIVCTDAYRSSDAQSIHKGHRNEPRENHHYLAGKEVLIDALILSDCDYLICGYSNVAYAAIVLNRNRYEEVILLENDGD